MLWHSRVWKPHDFPFCSAKTSVSTITSWNEMNASILTFILIPSSSKKDMFWKLYICLSLYFFIDNLQDYFVLLQCILRNVASIVGHHGPSKCWGKFSSVQFSSVAQSCPTLCYPMNCSTPGLPVHHHLPEFTQTRVHRVCDAIQPSHPLSSPSPPAPNPSQHQSLFQWVNSSHEVAKVLELQL